MIQYICLLLLLILFIKINLDYSPFGKIQIFEDNHLDFYFIDIAHFVNFAPRIISFDKQHLFNIIGNISLIGLFAKSIALGFNNNLANILFQIAFVIMLNSFLLSVITNIFGMIGIKKLFKRENYFFRDINFNGIRLIASSKQGKKIPNKINAIYKSYDRSNQDKLPAFLSLVLAEVLTIILSKIILNLQVSSKVDGFLSVFMIILIGLFVCFVWFNAVLLGPVLVNLLHGLIILVVSVTIFLVLSKYNTFIKVNDYSILFNAQITYVVVYYLNKFIFKPITQKFGKN